MRRGLFIFLAVVLSGWFAPTAQGLTRPPAGPIPNYDALVPAGDVVLGVGITLDTDEGNKEDPLSLHKYLYCRANPVDGGDPTGHDFDMVSLMTTTGIGESLESMYNSGVMFAFLAMEHTIIGVQNEQTESAIVGSYFKDVAIGIGIGVAIGAVADIAGDLVYGGTVEGEPISIEVSGANTVEGSRGFAVVESTTEDLMGAAARAAKVVERESDLTEGMKGFGTKAHTQFAKEVKAMGLNSEVSYVNGNLADYYGQKGSIRLDAVKGDRMHPQAVYDLKTGGAKLTPERVQQIRANLPNGYGDIPIIEIRIQSATSGKAGGL